ncbi:MAG: hypothetical protein K2Y21_11900 [Phycisphaerales bacterium]|nr:hypothetical protein [Phycisphaerales bacterium]
MQQQQLRGRRSGCRSALALVGALAALGHAAHAQEAINTESATQPGVGTLYVKPQFRVWRYGVSRDPASPVQGVTRVESSVTLQYGLAKDWSLSLKVPAVVQEQTFPASRNLAASIGQIEAMFKLRVYRSDTSALDTVRAVVYGGAMLPSGDDTVAPQSVDPFVGASVMLIRGRWGLTQSLRYTVTTGADSWKWIAPGTRSAADSLRYDTALMYRVFPAEFTAENSSSAWYASLELNGQYETSGDNEILLAPGLLYEAKRFAAEFSVGLPIVKDVRDRPATQLQVSVGLRFVF